MDHPIFDHIEATHLEWLAPEPWRRRHPFRIRLENVGEGQKVSAWLGGEVAEDAIALVQAQADPLSGAEPVSTWLIESIARRANAHENDGEKLHKLMGEELLYDRRYVAV